MYRMKGRVYVIYSESTGLAYYGSTIQTLEERFASHIYKKKCHEKGKSNYCSSNRVLDCGDAEICIVEEVEVNTKVELKKYENFYVKNNPCVNERIPNRTLVEWYHDNREAVLKKKKQYKQINREQINKKNKVKHTCACGGKYTHINKSQHFKTNRHLQFLSQQTVTLTAP
jgi:hypothetical protein